MEKGPQSRAIAIIGFGCRSPGKVGSPSAHWDLLKNGIDSLTEVPRVRFDIETFSDADPDKPGKVISRYGDYISDINLFDAIFFGMPPCEAARLDPQQRLLLEVAWETLEVGDQSLEAIAGSRTGVFVGLVASDYEKRMFSEVDTVDLYAATGSAIYSTAGRLSYAFELRGPSIALGNACSSSLTPVHLAVKSLCWGECRMVLALVERRKFIDLTNTISRFQDVYEEACRDGSLVVRDDRGLCPDNAKIRWYIFNIFPLAKSSLEFSQEA